MCKYCDQHSNDCCIHSDPLTKEWYENIETFEWDNYDDGFVHYNVQKAEEGLEHESITNTCTDAGAKPGLF